MSQEGLCVYHYLWKMHLCTFKLLPTALQKALTSTDTLELGQAPVQGHLTTLKPCPRAGP
jgi:hypothetical protein